MIFEDVLVEITQKYPRCPVKKLPAGREHPREFIVVFEPTEKHPEWSMGLSYVLSSEPHHHKKIRELYIVERGEIELFVGTTSFIMGEGSWRVVPENTTHWMHATVNAPSYAIVRIYSSPGWTLADHHSDKEIV